MAAKHVQARRCGWFPIDGVGPESGCTAKYFSLARKGGDQRCRFWVSLEIDGPGLEWFYAIYQGHILFQKVRGGDPFLWFMVPDEKQRNVY